MAAGERLKLLMESQKGKPNGVAGLNESGKVPSGQLPAMDYVPTSRKVNGKALTADITLSAADTGAIQVAEKGAAGGVATLDDSGKVPREQLPAMNYDPAGSAAAVQKNLDGHIDNKNNPHVVTAEQVGALPINGGTLTGNLRTNAEIIVGVNKAAFTFEGDTDPLKVWASNIGGEASIKFGGANDYSGGVFQMLETGIVLAESITGYSPNKQTSFVTKKYVDNLLSQLPAPPNLKYGTYVGRGTFGSGSPNSLTLDFEPQLVIITGQHSGSQVAWPLLFMRNNTTAFEMGEGAYTCKVTWNGKIVKWYSTENAGRQMNYNGRTYYYFAIGEGG